MGQVGLVRQVGRVGQRQVENNACPLHFSYLANQPNQPYLPSISA